MSAVVVVIGLGLCLGLGLGGCQKGVTPEARATASSPGAPAAGSAAPTAAAGTAAQLARPAPARPAPPPGSAVPGAAMAASADVAAPKPPEPAAPAPPATPAPITLPKSPETRVRRTTRPLTRKQLERLSAIEHVDFERQERGKTDDTIELRHTTVARPKLGVTIKIDTCTVARAGKGRPARRRPAPPDPRACIPMKLERWQARGDELKQFLSKDLVDRPDTHFEVGTRGLWGATAIYTYQLGHFFGSDERGQPVGAYSDAYVLYYNDGVNRIQVIASYLDDAVSREQLVAIAPREDLEKLAVAFARFYLHAWR